MLLANTTVAEKILKEFPDCACLRRHPAPPLSNFEPVRYAARVKVSTASHVMTWQLYVSISARPGTSCMAYCVDIMAIHDSGCMSRSAHVRIPPALPTVLIWMCMLQGFELEVESNKKLAESLNECEIADNPYFNTLLRIMTTRCMMQAVYFSSGMLDREEYQHYGLATPIYTHYTSPIRR